MAIRWVLHEREGTVTGEGRARPCRASLCHARRCGKEVRGDRRGRVPANVRKHQVSRPRPAPAPGREGQVGAGDRRAYKLSLSGSNGSPGSRQAPCLRVCVHVGTRSRQYGPTGSQPVSHAVEYRLRPGQRRTCGTRNQHAAETGPALHVASGGRPGATLTAPSGKGARVHRASSRPGAGLFEGTRGKASGPSKRL